MSLSEYRRKRDLDKSREPEGGAASKKHPIFVVQKHDATNLHYDFRLEVDGVLWSWAVPKGPSLNPEDKRLALMVEDHPLDYAGFEGTIPKGNYGGGTVMVWDTGVYMPRDEEHPKRAMHLGRHSGKITVVLSGEKLKGEFALVRAPARGENAWLLIKKRDEYVSEADVLKKDKSALSKRSLDQIAKSTRSWNEGGDRNDSMPHRIKPMLAAQVDEPFNNPEWVYEIKWDGYRALAEVKKEGVELYSRNLLSFNQAFAPIVDSLKEIAHDVVFDGEVVVVDAAGRSSFQRLQSYRRTGEADGELLYYIFDLLYLDGRDLTGLGLLERKSILEKLIPKRSRLRYSEHIGERGIDFFTAAKTQELEGIMAKKADSPYRIGRRSEEWLKIKTVMRQEAVIVGFTEPKGSRKLLGALVLGVRDGDQLIYIGHTGGGFDEKSLKEVHSLLKPLKIERSAFKIVPKTNAPATWVKPTLVCEVKFQEWTGDGHMRKPIFLGLRPDKSSQDVHKEAVMPEQKAVKKASQSPISTVKTKANLTHLDKVFWPREGYTKGDLIDYYHSVAKYILPYLKDRPESLNRFPNGIDGDSFFQKDVDHQPPDWVKVVPIHSESGDKDIRFLICQDENTLLYMANLGCIEINPWNSRTKALDKPDFLVIDLDPEDIGFEKVVEAAQHVHRLFDELGVDNYCKTSGATGLHIYVPLGAKYDYEQSKNFAHLVATMINRELPDTTSLERSPAKRQQRVYLDFLQNRRGQTLAAPYSVRPRPGATVSTPLEWSEVKKGLDPTKFTIKTIGQRLAKKGDLWKPVLGKGMDMAKALKRLESLSN